MGCISGLFKLLKRAVEAASSSSDGNELQPRIPKEPVIRPNGEALSFHVEELGQTREIDPQFVEIGRDGSGGGRINGHNIVLFSDTLVKGIGPLTCTIVYSDDRDPCAVMDFGGGGCPKQGIPYIPEEQDYNDKGNYKTRVAIWPQGSISPIPGDRKRGIGVAPVSIQSLPEAPQPSHDIYTTLYTITAGDEPQVERTVPKLWMADQVNYGPYGTLLDPQDGMYYFFANEQETDNQGIKVARADPKGRYTDVRTWEFWDGSKWVNTPPAKDASRPILKGKFSSGDIFWSENLGTYMTVYFLHNVDSTFRYRYALPDESGKVSLTGRWSEEFVLYQTGHLCNGGYGFNFAGHAYPKHDQTGEWLVMSCTLSNGVTPFFFRARLNL